MKLSIRSTLVTVFLLALAVSLLADDQSTRRQSRTGSPSDSKQAESKQAESKQYEKSSAKVKQPPRLILEREAAALTFVKKNHADLDELLLFLKQNRPEDYRQAIQDLYRTSERLAQFHDRGDTQRYELELKAWQAQSRGQLIVARLKMNDSQELRAELRGIVNEQLELRRHILQLDRDRLAGRLQKLDEQIARNIEKRDEEIDRQIRVLTRSSKTTKKTSSPPPAASQKSSATEKPRTNSRPKKPKPSSTPEKRTGQ